MIDMAWLSAIILGAGCLALGYIIGVRHSSRTSLSNKASGGTETLVDGKKKKGVKPPLEVERLAEILEDFKMVLVVRNDLKMGKGKIAAQCSHATLGLYKKLHNRAPKALNRWEMCGQVKVVVKIEREEDMLLLQERAKSLNIPTHITIDAGRTQIAPSAFISSFTCGGTLCQDAAFGSPPIRSAHFTQPATLHITEAPEVPLRALSAEVSAVHNTGTKCWEK
ncbi:uncharacterized protein LOC107766742 isoform X4 [Nicotiana tabacum]|uniref:Uncharacterized protein LOC107766742 isoform X4 n=1 Tax=Nicotiana tabacum TaxID=4097 RepID=A0AC58U3I8_TOBAC